jgi:predicted Zn-dependent protease with MMP-like domain
MRGPLGPAHLPVVRTRAERFDDAVLDALEHLERHWGTELAGVQVLVEEVPRPPADGQDRVEVPLGRVEPARRRRAPRLVVYRRPIEARARDRQDLEDLTQAVLTDLVADLLGRSPEEIDPDAPQGGT